MADIERTELQAVEHAVAHILAEVEAPVEVYAAVLEAIGSALDWELGAVWELGSDWQLRCICTWHAGWGAPEFATESERIVLRAGEGLPGRVVLSGQPLWVVDPPNDANFPRAAIARRVGLHAAFGFPLQSPRGTLGAMEFFTRELREPDEQLLQTMHVLGSQVGQFVARRRAEEGVRANESRLRAMLDAALDAVVTMDQKGVVLGWNHAAEATFGYTPEEAIGADMAELIVPRSLRERHRRGLARYLETGRAAVLDQRLELVGMHKDGHEFPVELTITRITLPGAPTFTGYLRDVTERRRADAELRASRARIVEAADNERQRIQRNLHDGAQQRLTAVLLNLGRLREVPALHDDLLGQAIDELATGLEELRELAAGLHPSVLAERGLPAALEALALRAPIAVEVETAPAGRLPEQLEAAAYYVVAESLANVQKHAGASRVVVSAQVDGDVLVVDVSDDGIGGADEEGAGLRGLVDRVEALGGKLTLDSPPGAGTRLRVEIPT